MSGAKQAMERALAQLIEFFNVDQSFLRRNNHAAGTSILAAEWPVRPEIPSPDPIYEVPFSADPVFGMCEHLAETYIAYPEDSPDYQERIKAGSGQELTTMAMVPLRQEEATLGVLGLIRHNDDRWAKEEVATLGAIASLLAQMWGRHDAESKILHHAFYDELTDLPNRRMLELEVAKKVQTEPASLLVIDVDNMKIVNDGLNYSTGDLFLQAMADRLRATVRPGSMVARLAGDQFAVLTTNADSRNVESLARRLVEELGRPYDIGGVPIVRTVSIGIAHDAPGMLMAGQHDLELLKDAGVAMSEAKKAGKNR
ncbi:MAG: diguanylate cyclase, partial [Actinomycetota bacterium]